MTAPVRLALDDVATDRSVEEMVALLKKARQVLSPDQLWVNPDCGLKTRGSPEVEQALIDMVEAARQMRQEARTA